LRRKKRRAEQSNITGNTGRPRPQRLSSIGDLGETILWRIAKEIRAPNIESTRTDDGWGMRCEKGCIG
jgi:hypothetical protein